MTTSADLITEPTTQPAVEPTDGRLELPSPPALRPREGGGGAMMNAIPMIGGIGGMIVVATMGGAGPVRFVVAGLFGFTMVAFVLVQFDRQRGQRRGQVDAQRADYLRHLVRARARVRAAAGHQRRAALWQHPDPAALAAVVAERSRVWERNPAHPQFLCVRYGLTERPLALELVPPDDVAGNAADPMCESAVRRLIGVHGVVPDLPAILDLRAVPCLELGGPAGREVARALVCQLATFHPPDRLVIAALVAPDALVAWDWLKWLPHTRRPEVAHGPARAMAAAVTRLTADLPADAHLVLIADGVATPSPDRLRESGITVLALERPPADPSAAGRAVLTCSGADATLHHGRGDPTPVRPDRLSVPEAEAVGRRLLDHGTTTAGPRTSTGSDLLGLLGLGELRRLDPESCWHRTDPSDRLRVPIGVDDDGRPVRLDLNESALGGMGPHGLVVGATGSGKSEVLRTLVLGLALTHPPEDLNLVLVDFKGGASFAGLGKLPHVSAVITNLADDLGLVDRMQDALSGELVRRQELLREAGHHVSVHDYETARLADPSLPALPALVIVVDEFSELLTARPDFIDLFLAIGRLGRSLGLHLLLASQRLEEGRLRGLESHLSYRIGLRTFSAAESRAVLGVPDAFGLPAVPGAGYLQAGPAPLRRFHAAYVSGPPPPPAAQTPDRAAIRPFTLTDLPRVPDVSAPRPGDEGPKRQGPGEEEAPQRSLLELVVARLAGRGTPAHRIWLPPLDLPEPLDRLFPDLTVDPTHGLTSPSWRRFGGLVVPLGMVDRPHAQRRDPLVLDLRGAGGHVAVVGGPRSGKSTLARTLLAGLALVGTPQETQFYVLDFGGGTFAPFAEHPHVAAVATRSTPDLVRRVLTEVEDLVERREAYFAEHGIDTIETYRARRARGQADDGWGEAVLLIDGWSALRTEIEDAEPRLQALAARALAYGVHLVLTASRWADFRLDLRDAFGTRLELRLGSPVESEIDHRLAAGVPTGRPGRGLTPTREHFLAALPSLGGTMAARTPDTAIDDLIARTRAGWTGPPGPKLRVLPDRVDLADLTRQQSGRDLVLGLAERDQRVVTLDPGRDPHLLVFGDHRSGKTTLLRGIARELIRTRTPREAQLVVVDYRRSLLGEVPDAHLLHDLTSAAAADPALHELAAYLRTRLPGPHLGPEALRDRSWWSGADVFVLVDDHDLVSSSRGSPLTPLLPLLPQARDVGLHLVLARRTGGAGRALFEPTIQTLRELGQPGLLLAGSPEEGPLLGGLRPASAPPGRARSVTRERSPEVIQLAWSEPSA